MRKTTLLTVSMPKDIFDQLEKQRGDVTRSRFVCKIIKEHLNLKEKKEADNDKRR